MVRKVWRGALAAMLLGGAGLAWSQTTPNPTSSEKVYVLQENDKKYRCRLIQVWKLSDGTTAQLMQDVKTGEKVTLVDQVPSKDVAVIRPGEKEPNAVAKRMYFWGANAKNSPQGAPVPPGMRTAYPGVIVKQTNPSPETIRPVASKAPVVEPNGSITIANTQPVPVEPPANDSKKASHPFWNMGRTSKTNTATPVEVAKVPSASVQPAPVPAPTTAAPESAPLNIDLPKVDSLNLSAVQPPSTAIPAPQVSTTSPVPPVKPAEVTKTSAAVPQRLPTAAVDVPKSNVASANPIQIPFDLPKVDINDLGKATPPTPNAAPIALPKAEVTPPAALPTAKVPEAPGFVLPGIEKAPTATSTKTVDLPKADLPKLNRTPTVGTTPSAGLETDVKRDGKSVVVEKTATQDSLPTFTTHELPEANSTPSATRPTTTSRTKAPFWPTASQTTTSPVRTCPPTGNCQPLFNGILSSGQWSNGSSAPKIRTVQDAPSRASRARPFASQSVLASKTGSSEKVAYIPIPVPTTPDATRPPVPPFLQVPQGPQLNANVFHPRAPQGPMPAPYGINPYVYQSVMTFPQMQGTMMTPNAPYAPPLAMNIPRAYNGPTPPNPFGQMPATVTQDNYMAAQMALVQQQQAAQIAMAQQQQKAQLDYLFNVLRESPLPSEREFAAQTLAQNDLRNDPYLLNALLHTAQHDPAPTVRAGVVQCLARTNTQNPLVVQALGNLKSDADQRVRQEAESALIRLAGHTTPAGTASGTVPASATPSGVTPIPTQAPSR